MAFGSNVQPKRKVKAQAASNWKCGCGKDCTYYWLNCPSCGQQRPY